jgi:hypothetical protein
MAEDEQGEMEAKDRHQLMERQPSSIGISKSEAINELQ